MSSESVLITFKVAGKEPLQLLLPTKGDTLDRLIDAIYPSPHPESKGYITLVNYLMTHKRMDTK